MTFRNPANGYIERIDSPALWTFFFGSFYLGFKGAWGWAVIGILLSGVTLGVFWLILPFFAESILRKHFLQKGWIEESHDEGTSPPPKRTPHQEAEHQRKLAEVKRKMGW
jgi:hypothetical protein